MTTKICPACSSENDVTNGHCPGCGHSFFSSGKAKAIPPAQVDAGQHTPTKSTATKAIVVLLTFGHIGLWGIAIIIFASLGVGMEKSISDAQSAPHQAAAAAMGVGEIAIAYCVVRGVSEILKTLLKSADVVL